jgi:hypothetical protein
MREILLGRGSGVYEEGWFDPAGARRLVERLEGGERLLALPVYSLVAWELWRQQVLEK